jgi:protein ImuA
MTTQEIVRKLQDRIRRLERVPRAAGADIISTGWPPLDRLLPSGGLRRGSLVEWLGTGPGSGAAMLAAGGARQAAEAGGAIVVVDPLQQVYPPALAAWGVDLDRVVFIHPQNQKDEGWAWDQALRCPCVAAVWGWIERIEGREFRRWQLAVETSGCVGLLMRSDAARNQPTWADVRLGVEPQRGARGPRAGVVVPSSHDRVHQPDAQARGNWTTFVCASGECAGRRLRVEVLHCRGAACGGSVQLVLDEWTGQLHEGGERHASLSRSLAAPVARAKARPRATGTDGMSGRRL